MPQKYAPLYNISLRPLRVFMYLLGVLPCECCQQRPASKQRLRRSLKQLVWQCSHLLLVCSGVMVISLQRYKSLNYVYDANDSISNTMDFIGFSTVVLVHFVAQVESTWKSQHYQRIFARFECMRAQFGGPLKIRVNCALIRHYSVLLYGVLVLYWAIFIFLTLLLQLDTHTASRVLMTYYSELVLKLKLIECLLLVVIVFVMLTDLCVAGEEFMLDLQRTRFDPWLGRRRACLARIFILQDLHAQLWANLRLIESYWEWSMPGLLLKIYLDCMLMAYWVYLSFLCETSVYIKIYCLGIMLMQYFVFIVSCVLCAKCEKLDKKFRTLFHGIAHDRQNIFLSSCLRQMSLQLMHEPIQFSAGGFVDMNKNTLGKFTFSVITYMVILVQFRMSV